MSDFTSLCLNVNLDGFHALMRRPLKQKNRFRLRLNLNFPVHRDGTLRLPLINNSFWEICQNTLYFFFTFCLSTFCTFIGPQVVWFSMDMTRRRRTFGRKIRYSGDRLSASVAHSGKPTLSPPLIFVTSCICVFVYVFLYLFN